MYNQSSAGLSPQVTQETTELERILNVLSNQNNDFVNVNLRLASIGHRAKNTSVPEKQSTQESQSPDGLLQAIFLQLEFMRKHLCDLELATTKLSSLI